METRLFRRMTFAILAMTALLAAQDTIPQGTYKGQWKGASANGDLYITFRDAGDGKLTPEVGFTLGGEDVVTKVLSFKTEGAKFWIVYQFDAQGNVLQSAVEGMVKGKSMEGTYKTTAGDQAVDSGTFTLSAVIK